MKKQNKFIIIALSVFVIVGILAFYSVSNNKKETNTLDDFAKCITNSGAKFYGAFWCSHCQAQKNEFGSSKEFLPYVECSSADAKSQTDVCKEAGVEAYPTWIFADGTKQLGEISFEELAEKTSCPLPSLE